MEIQELDCCSINQWNVKLYVISLYCSVKTEKIEIINNVSFNISKLLIARSTLSLALPIVL